MRTMLVSVLAVLAQLAIPANAQPQAAAQPASPAATNGYVAQPPAKRVFFFRVPRQKGPEPIVLRPLDLKYTSGSAESWRPSQAPGHRTWFFANPAAQIAAHPTLEFQPLTLESMPPQDIRKILRPRTNRLFFFSKP